MITEPAAVEVGRSPWRPILDSVAVGIVVVGRDGRSRYANAAAASILGHETDALTGLTSFDPRWEAQAPDGTPLPGDRHPTAIALQTGEAQHEVPLTIAHPDGRRRRLRVTAIPYRDAAGELDGVVASFEDVTVAYDAEQALVDSELRYRLLAENAADVVARGDLTGHIQWLSPSVRTLLGYAPEALVGHDLAELVHPADLGAFTGLRDTIGHGAPAHADIRMRSASGAWRWFRISANVARDADGRIVGRIGGWLAIDGEVRERESLRKALAELHEAQAIAHVGSWTRDTAGRTAWSDELYRIHGLPVGSPVGDPAWYAGLIAGDGASRFETAVGAALTAGDPFGIELEIRRPDGALRSLIVRGEPIRDASGRITGIRGTATDITETVRRRETSRRRAAHRADYVARAAHRLRTSLGVVSGWAELLAEQGDELDQSARQVAHQAIGRNATRLAASIEALLAEMVEEARLASLEPVPVDVARIACRVVEEQRADASVAAIEVAPTAGLIALAGEEALATALHLALEHAVERSAPDGRVTVSIEPDPPGHVRVAVRDDGPPLEPGGDPFAAFEPTAANGGIDLGLHLVRTLAEAMGGTAEAIDRADGAGLEVVLRLLVPAA